MHNEFRGTITQAGRFKDGSVVQFEPSISGAGTLATGKRYLQLGLNPCEAEFVFIWSPGPSELQEFQTHIPSRGVEAWIVKKPPDLRSKNYLPKDILRGKSTRLTGDIQFRFRNSADYSLAVQLKSLGTPVFEIQGQFIGVKRFEYDSNYLALPLLLLGFGPARAQ